MLPLRGVVHYFGCVFRIPRQNHARFQVGNRRACFRTFLEEIGCVRISTLDIRRFARLPQRTIPIPFIIDIPHATQFGMKKEKSNHQNLISIMQLLLSTKIKDNMN